MNILEVSGLRVRYGRGSNSLLAVEGVDLSVPRGRTLGLVGESGCGKSSIARALVALAPVASGSIRLDGKDCSSPRARGSSDYRRRVQMIFQDPFGSLNPRMSVGEMMAEAASMRPGLRRDSSARVREIVRTLDLVGLPTNIFDRFPHQFSGGQRQRLAIARALAVGPDVVIADEVTSALDVSIQATILNLLTDLQEELGLSYVLISHDLAVVRAMSDVLAVMYLGRIVEHAVTEDVFRTPSHPYTRALISSIPVLGERRKPAPLAGDLPDPRRPPAGCRFHTRCPVGPEADPTRTICTQVDPQTISGEKLHGAACHFAAASATYQTTVDASSVPSVE